MSIATDLARAVREATKGWKTEKRHADRYDRVSYHSLAKLRGGYDRVTIKQVAFEVMEEAYNQASDKGRYYAHARQVMYPARRLMLAKEPSLSNQIDSGFGAYFTQTLLKDYIEEYSADWKVVWDARGHLIEPFTGRNIGLGGVAVGKYIQNWEKGFDEYPEVLIEKRVETEGPINRYGGVLFIEKEGFTEILKDAGIERRYDIALMSTKGIPVKAACDLANALESMGVLVYALRDFDFAGFKIVRTWRIGTRLAKGTNIVEIGLRWDDIADLDSEPVEYSQRKDPRKYLAECGATKQEQNFLVEGHHDNVWFGRRVEINAMTSGQLIEWLEKKLKENGVKKIIPANDTLVSAYRRARYFQELQAKVEEWKEEEHDAAPKNLTGRVKKILAKQPDLSWDEAVWNCADEDSDESEE